MGKRIKMGQHFGYGINQSQKLEMIYRSLADVRLNSDTVN